MPGLHLLMPQAPRLVVKPLLSVLQLGSLVARFIVFSGPFFI